MDIPTQRINADAYRVSTAEFEPVSRSSDPYASISAVIGNKEIFDGPITIRLDGSGEEWKQQLVYTVGLEQSLTADATIPIFEIQIPVIDPEREKEHREQLVPGKSATGYERIRALFIDEDIHDTVQGLGPIGKCLKASQDQEVILFLRGVDRLPGRAQSSFFELLERSKRSYGVEITGNPDDLYIFSTTDRTADREPLDLKFRHLLGGTYTME